jgi:thiamine biosynthesis lipoprotein
LVLEKQGIQNYMVEIGGEIRVKGLNEQGKPWRIGIDEPTDDQSPTERKLQKIIHISNAAMATSGNYRQFYIKNGKKYAHTINPKTGYPVQHSLLSASVVAPDCMTADAYATAFMVLGYHASNDIVEQNPELEAYFILSGNDKNTYEVKYTKGMEKYFE